MSEQYEYGEYEAVNGGIVNDARKRITSLEDKCAALRERNEVMLAEIKTLISLCRCCTGQMLFTNSITSGGIPDLVRMAENVGSTLRSIDDKYDTLSAEVQL